MQPPASKNCSIHFGTCAWSHDDWRGIFYPDHLPAGERLEFYSKYLKAVEVDSTFYHAPTIATSQHWVDVTPKDFVFACKVPREITHDHKLRDCEDLLASFLDGIRPMRERLGGLLIELPHWFDPWHDEVALKDFVRNLPPGWPWAIEFRHPGWHTPRTIHLLEANRIAWVWSDMTPLGGADVAAFELHPVTSSLVFIRLLGDAATKYRPDGSQAHHYTSIQWPRTNSLENWAEKIRQCQAQASRVLIFAADHFEGFAPLTIQRLAKNLNVEVGLPPGSVVHPESDDQKRQMKLWD